MLDFILHLDKYVAEMVKNYGPWAYGILFAVVFAETGLVVTPFLPGDSLLFMLGIFSRPERGAFNVWAIFFLLSTAAILGDQLNYQIGKFLGERMFRNPNSKIFRRSHLEKTQEFYDKHGPKTVMLARFVPVVRALAPFVAGMTRMQYGTFTAYSVVGAFLWVGVCTFAGYLFGAIPIVRERFEIGIFLIVGISLLPMFFEVWRHSKKKKQKAAESAAQASSEA